MLARLKPRRNLNHHYRLLTLNWIYTQKVLIINLLSKFKELITITILTGFCITS